MEMASTLGSENNHSFNGKTHALVCADLSEMEMEIITAPDDRVDDTVKLWAGRIGDMQERESVLGCSQNRLSRRHQYRA